MVYALALGAPVAILTSAAGLHVFPDAWAWIAGGSLGVWILAAGGTVLNQYAQTGWERLAARHLGRLGVLGAAVLFSFFTHIVFFPSASWGFWLLLGIAAVILVIPWILVRSNVYYACLYAFLFHLAAQNALLACCNHRRPAPEETMSLQCQSQ